MRSLFAFVVLAVSQSIGAEEAEFEFRDPRTVSSYFGGPFEVIRAGEDVKDAVPFDSSILIIHWAAKGYEISGVPGLHTQERVEAFLRAFYSRDIFPRPETKALHAIVCGNNWGAAMTLDPCLRALSKEYGFSVFHAGGYFRSAKLIEEPEPRKKLILRAFERSEPKPSKAEKSSNADQPNASPK